MNNVTGKVDGVDLMQTKYVKVATQEIAFLVQAIRNSQAESEEWKDKFSSLEKQVSFQSQTIRSDTVNNSLGFSNDKQEDATPGASVQYVVTQFGEKRKVSPAVQKTNEDISNQSSNLTSRGAGGGVCLSSSDLEVDCAVEAPPVNETIKSYRSAPELIGRSFAYDNASIQRTLSSGRAPAMPYDASLYRTQSSNDATSAIASPTRLTSITENLQPTCGTLQIGVAKNYFDSAVAELEKCKKLNSQLIEVTRINPKYAMNVVELQQLLMESQNENKKLKEIHRHQREQHKDGPQDNPDSVIHDLRAKLYQQERKTSLNNMALDELNKQCDLWKVKYETVKCDNIKLSKRIVSLLDPNTRYVDFGVQTDGETECEVPHFEMLESGTININNNTHIATPSMVDTQTSDNCEEKLDNSVYLLPQEAREGQETRQGDFDLAKDRFNLTAEVDYYNQRYQIIQEENRKLRSENAREKVIHNQKLTQINHQLFSMTAEKNKLLNTFRDASLAASNDRQLMSLPMEWNSGGTTLLKTIQMISSSSDRSRYVNMGGAFSELFFNDSDDVLRTHGHQKQTKYNSDPIRADVHRDFSPISL